MTDVSPSRIFVRIFVAGASGVIGQRLCRLLVADGWRVFGTTRTPEKAALLRALGVEPVIVDVFDARALRDAVVSARPEVVIHQLTDLPPGLDPARMADALVRNAHIRDVGTRHLVAAAIAAGVQRLVAQSIAFAYAPGALPYREDAPLDLDSPDPLRQQTVRGVARLEHQVTQGPFTGIVLRYGKLYGPGTGFTTPSAGGPLHVDAAADGARRAASLGVAGIYNMAEPDGTVCIDRAVQIFGWQPSFRMT